MSLNASLMSVLAMNVLGECCCTSLIASVIDAYCTVESAFEMLWFTERESSGYDRLCKSLNLPGVDFSLRDNGDDLKLAKGGCWKGPSILPREISLSSFFWTSPEFWVAVKAFLLVRGHSGPSKSSLNPFKNPSVRYSAWYPSSNLHSLSGCIGLDLFVTGAGTFIGGVSAVAYVACV